MLSSKLLHISCPLLLKIEKFIHLGKLSRSDEIYSVENITTLLIQKKTSFKLQNTKLGRFSFTSPRRWRRRQTRQRLFTLPKSPAGDVLSIIGNSVNAGDTGFAG